MDRRFSAARSPRARSSASPRQKVPHASPCAPSELPSGLQANALEIHCRLCSHVGCPLQYFPTIDPLNELIAVASEPASRFGQGLPHCARVFRTEKRSGDVPVAEVKKVISGRNRKRRASTRCCAQRSAWQRQPVTGIPVRLPGGKGSHMDG